MILYCTPSGSEAFFHTLFEKRRKWDRFLCRVFYLFILIKSMVKKRCTVDERDEAALPQQGRVFFSIMQVMVITGVAFG